MIDRRQMIRTMAVAPPSLAFSALSATSFSTPAAMASEVEPRSSLPPLSLPNPWTSNGFLRRAGGVLHYASMGQNEDLPPVILLHKLGGWIADWRDLAPYLAEKRRIIAIDLPGHGESQWSGPPPRVQTVFETAALIVGALQEWKTGPVDIVGSSLGGCIAVAIAALYPDIVRRVSLPSCVLGKASSEADVAKKEMNQASFWDAQGRPLPVDPLFSRDTFGLVNYQRIALEQDHSRERAGLWIKPQERGVAFTDFLELLPRILAPTQLLYGDRDHFFIQYRDPAMARLKHGSDHIIAGASGLHVQDQPEETAAVIAAFLNKN